MSSEVAWSTVDGTSPLGSLVPSSADPSGGRVVSGPGPAAVVWRPSVPVSPDASVVDRWDPGVAVTDHHRIAGADRLGPQLVDGESRGGVGSQFEQGHVGQRVGGDDRGPEPVRGHPDPDRRSSVEG